MFKLMTTIARGRAHESAEMIAARNATTILSQQIRDAASALDNARRALAITEASFGRDEARLHRLTQTIEDLEGRVVAAIEKGRDDLAREGAEEIAQLEAERDLARKGVELLRNEIARRRPQLRDCEARLRRLCLGRDLVSARAQARRLGGPSGTARLSRLGEAEQTLARIETAQSAEDAAFADHESGAGRPIVDRLAEAGCGPARPNSAVAVIERLRQRIEAQ
ncbi:PspA/IM30 family protein [Jiella mangrovi]|uniref:PspA/IM30 family protein n=1 Tax=Jiella mangrovi TaxID=2821407 RepID=A0ABS4BLP7_9HYPH|nr:PspA/IM30 family protein [Jiella mangrovi]MBP0617658.1 PspA/IM30 family protein [Jiella mangrovi]